MMKNDKDDLNMMNRRTLLCFGALTGGLCALPTWAVAETGNVEDPYQWVVTLSNQVLDAIKKDPSLKSGDITAINTLVDQLIMPDVDFTMVTRMTVGPKWRQATPEQRQALQEAFKQLLIRVYSGALSKVKDHVCELDNTRKQSIQDEMVIRTKLISAGQPPIAMDYRIYRNKHQVWKIVDVNVEGVWMVENYRTQFSSVLNQDGIDGLIKSLQARVKENK